jgi:pyridoxine 5-phosphate synthase
MSQRLVERLHGGRLQRPDGLRLGVNIDHVATIRNARGGVHPDPVRAAKLAAAAGADGITAHLREDRRHISDEDILRLTEEVQLPLNLEMAPTDEMVEIALRHRPHAACLVPEKREELTTEGGLDVAVHHNLVAPIVRELSGAGIRVLHTGSYCDAEDDERVRQLERLESAAQHAAELGLECHAGHGLSFETVGPVAAIPQVAELNIGHFLVGEAIFGGLDTSIRRMRALIDEARGAAGLSA